MYVSWQTIAPFDYYYFLTTDNTLDPHYNALRYNADSVATRLKSWFPIFWDWLKLDIDSTVSVKRLRAVLRPTKWAGPLGPAIDLIVIYIRT